MYIGRFYHRLEEKGRVSLPKSFRDQTKSFIITRGLDGGLFLFDESSWTKDIASLTQTSITKKNTRDFIRLMTNDAMEIKPDSLGRILISEYLREFAGLKKEVVIVGSLTRIEIWDVTKYHDYIKSLEPQAEQIAEQISQPAQERES